MKKQFFFYEEFEHGSVGELPTEGVDTANETVEELKEEVNERDDKILAALDKIHTELVRSNEHHVNHLINHTVAQSAPIQEGSHELAEEVTPKSEEVPESVSLEINEPKDMVKEEKKEKKARKAFGKRRK